MKKFYTSILLLLLLSKFCYSQTFEFSISYIGLNTTTDNYQFALIATPNNSVTNGNTSDMGAGFYVPSGLTIGNFVEGNSSLPGAEWSSIFMDSNANGDGYFLGRVEAAAQSVFLNGTGPFELVLFDVIADPNPTTGSITFVENGDPIFDTIFIQNYINIDYGSGYVDAYSQNDPTANSIMFSSVLSLDSYTIDKGFSIYPNPAKNDILIKELNNKIISKKEVFTVNGKKIATINNSTKKINISNLKTGLYLLRIHFESDETKTLKFIKE